MGGRSARTVAVLLTVTGVLLSVFLPTSPAAAHNSFTGSNPKNGAKVAAAPERIQLNFLSRVDPKTTEVTVLGPDNVPALGGEATFDGGKVVVPFKPGAVGLYIVGYEVLSSDGHTMSGEVRFTLTVGVTPSAPPTPTVAPTSAAPTASPPGAAAGPSPEPSAGESETLWWPWALGVVLAFAALGGGRLLFRRRNAG